MLIRIDVRGIYDVESIEHIQEQSIVRLLSGGGKVPLWEEGEDALQREKHMKKIWFALALAKSNAPLYDFYGPKDRRP